MTTADGGIPPERGRHGRRPQHGPAGAAGHGRPWEAGRLRRVPPLPPPTASGPPASGPPAVPAPTATGDRPRRRRTPRRPARTGGRVLAGIWLLALGATLAPGAPPAHAAPDDRPPARSGEPARESVREPAQEPARESVRERPRESVREPARNTRAGDGTRTGTTGEEEGDECLADTGPYQREMEEYLGRPVDGTQSPEDCAAIRAFQESEAISPADGYANLVTYRVMTAVRARDNPNADGKCPYRSYLLTCVDLDRQLLWVQRGDEVVFDPVPVRTGRDGEETRTGWHLIYWRSKDHVSTLYDTPMPYAQFFDGGQALHGRPDDLFDGGGSAGCVNLRLGDAAQLWELLDIDDALYIWGVKPGTAD